MARKAKKGEHTRSETISVRIPPKLKFGLELLARKQNRTMAGVIEWAIGLAVEDRENGLWYEKIQSPDEHGGQSITYEQLLEVCWDINEWRRIYNIYSLCPEFLTFEEQKLMRILADNAVFWGWVMLEPYVMTRHMVGLYNDAKIEAHWPLIKQNVDAPNIHEIIDGWVSISREELTPIPLKDGDDYLCNFDVSQFDKEKGEEVQILLLPSGAQKTITLKEYLENPEYYNALGGRFPQNYDNLAKRISQRVHDLDEKQQEKLRLAIYEELSSCKD